MLFHVPEPVWALAEARRVLGRGGWCGATVWGQRRRGGAADAVAELFDREGVPPDEADPARSDELIDTSDKLAGVLQAAGFVEVRSWSQPLAHRWDAEQLVAYLTEYGAGARRLERLPSERRRILVEQVRRLVAHAKSLDRPPPRTPCAPAALNPEVHADTGRGRISPYSASHPVHQQGPRISVQPGNRVCALVGADVGPRCGTRIAGNTWNPSWRPHGVAITTWRRFGWQGGHRPHSGWYGGLQPCGGCTEAAQPVKRPPMVAAPRPHRLPAGGLPCHLPQRTFRAARQRPGGDPPTAVVRATGHRSDTTLLSSDAKNAKTNCCHLTRNEILSFVN